MKFNDYQEKLKRLLLRLKKYYSSNDEYISQRILFSLKDYKKTLEEELRVIIKPYMIFKMIKMKKMMYKINNLIKNLQEYYPKNNRIYLDNKSKEVTEKVRVVNGYQIDQSQLDSILINDHNTLVIAGAGSGKTTTIIAKIKYLLINQHIAPEDILALTYTRAAAADMKKRIKEEININIDVYTFHKLGKEIITKVEGKVPTITNIELSKFVHRTILDLIDKDELYLENLVNYLFYNQYLLKSRFEFNDESSYEAYLKENPLITLNNEIVKSSEEVLIANFLLRNGIKYNYERNYIIDTSSTQYGQYKPDFYLPDYNIWIEHFAIDKEENVPSFFVGSEKLSAKEKYNEGMNWKRRIHQENNTILIETYSYENFNNKLLINLKNKLIEKGVEFKEISNKELIENFEKKNRSIYNGITELFGTVISLVRNSNYSIEEFQKIEMNSKASALRSLVVPILERYIKILNDFSELDFSDLLNIASNHIKDGKYLNPYKYVIVDEFQDLSKITYNLLTSLRDSNDYNLFCVGDDWQSIYRFAGSNISYITNFSKYFGIAEVFIIPKTYRFGQEISNISGKFIMKNKNQIQKNVVSANNNEILSIETIEGYTDYLAIEFLEYKLEKMERNSNILFLGRYHNDIKILNDSFIYRFNQNYYKVIYKKRRDLNITFRTVHSSKGLEEDYVFIINNKSGKYGFPSMIQENDIMNYLLEEPDGYPHSEERRLFYVALTRAKKKVWLVVNQGRQSIFIDEIKEQLGELKQNDAYRCPKCDKSLRIMKGQYGVFLGCSNYPKCKYTRNIN